MDVMSKKQRHTTMSHIRSKETKIEIQLRKALWKKGYRYRKNYKKLPGSPDIAITKYKIAIFCDSEFFHGYDWINKVKKLDTNKEYWKQKIERNMQRDKENEEALCAMGWIVLRFWGNDILKHTDDCVSVVEDTILQSVIEQQTDFEFIK